MTWLFTVIFLILLNTFSFDLCIDSPAYVKICYIISGQNIFLWGIDYILSYQYVRIAVENCIWKCM